MGVTNRQEPRLPIAVRSHPAPEPLLNRLHHQIPWLNEKGVRGDLRSNGSRTPTPERGHAETVPGAHGARDKLELQRAFLISCPTRVRFGVRRSVRRSVRPLNACPPEGPEALQACSLFQGTKAWLEPRLEPAETHPGAPVFEKRRSGTNKHCFAERFRRTRFDEQGVNKRPQRGLQGVQRAATRPKWAAEHCLAA